MTLYKLFRPFAFALDAETAHGAAIGALKLARRLPPRRFPASLRTCVAGIDFPSPVGLAAGFDKDAEVAEAMLGAGFGFVEVGTITPKPQQGNARPRLFRLVEDRAVINRMGFNNAGLDSAVSRLRKLTHVHGVIGANVGANKDSQNRIEDYVEGIRKLGPLARYLTINISSPNTPGLRGLQDEGALNELLAAIREARGRQAGPAASARAGLNSPPVFLKVAPDLGESDPDRIVRAALDHRIDALIIANTTISRPPLRSRHATEAGGLSGAPLRPLALEALRRFRSASGGEMPLIGVGGIETTEDAWERIAAGASLIQLYSAMVFEGPSIGMRIAMGLARRLAREGMSNISDAVGMA